MNLDGRPGPCDDQDVSFPGLESPMKFSRSDKYKKVTKRVKGSKGRKGYTAVRFVKKSKKKGK